MRHRVKGSRLNMRVGHRNSQRRTQVRQLFEYERIKPPWLRQNLFSPTLKDLLP